MWAAAQCGCEWMARADRLDFINVSGTSHQIGFQLGKRLRSMGKSIVTSCKARYESRDVPWHTVLKNARQFLPYAEEYAPSYLEMIRGYACGSGLRFEDLFVTMCGDEKGMCTDIALSDSSTADGSVLSAHTEDWCEEDKGHLALVKVKRKGSPEYLAMTFGGLEVIGGVNDAGISVTVNSLAPNDVRTGIPKSFVAHQILSCSRLDLAMKACIPETRGSAYNYNICHESGTIACVECSATDFSVLSPAHGLLVHTNHYLDPRMLRYETTFSRAHGSMAGYEASTIVRLNRARRLAKEILGSASVDGLMEILKDHANFPASICAHPDTSVPEQGRTRTIYSEVIDVTHRSMWIGLGNPCKAGFRCYKLRE